MKTNKNEMMAKRESIVMDQLEEIENLIHDMPAPGSGNLEWVHVGNLGVVSCKLSEIIDFLMGDEK